MKTTTEARPLLAAALALCAAALHGATWYVAPTGSDANPGTAVAPFATIQAGVNAAAAGDTVLVEPGVYDTGEQTTSNPSSGKSRLKIAKAVTVRSTQGAENTFIVGRPHDAASGMAFGANAVRCVYMTDGTLDGFTLVNGFADASACPPGDRDNPIANGGGVYAPLDNRAPQVNNCIITGCGAYRGGGAYWSTLNNCTVVSNYPGTQSGVGVWGSLVRNSIVVRNGDENYGSGATSVDPSLFQFSCTEPLPAATVYVNHDGGGNLAVDPQFLAGTLRLADSSPCINRGNNAFASGPRDAAGGARLLGGVVDIGAYESTYVLYPLAVVSGSGGGNYTNGAVVSVAADAPPGWTSFVAWTGDVAHVASVTNPNTTVTMPAAAVSIGASYHALSLADIVAEVLGLPQPVAVSNLTLAGVSTQPPEVRLGPVGDEGLAFISAVYTNAGTLLFPWRVSSEAGYDYLVLKIDGTEVAAISGETSAVVTQFVAGAGAHLIEWAYVKDVSDFDGADAGWVGPVTWIPDDLAAELGAPGQPLAFPDGLPGEPLPFPYGFEACLLDTAPPAGALGGAAVKLGGLQGGAPLVADGQTRSVEAVLNGAGLLTFQWRSSSQLSDYVVCSIDGAEAARISGTKSGWLTFTTNLLTVAAHTVRWSYVKGPDGFTGSDCGWIDSVTWTQFTFDLTVVDGTGSGTYAVGETVAVAADAPPAGMEFDAWDGDTEALADPAAASTTLVMPGRDLTVRALYRPETLSVTVVNGRDAGAWPNAAHESTGEPEGTYPAGALVRVVADPAPLWQTFDQWTASPAATFSDASADVSMFTMPASDVTVTATYRPQTEAERLAGALTVRGQPFAVTAFSGNGVVAEATGGVRYNDPVVKMGGPSVGPNQSVSLTTDSFTGDGLLLFWWSGEAEADYDGIQVVVNGSVFPTIFSEKQTNGVDKTRWWTLSYARVSAAATIAFRFTRDDTYYVRDNFVLLDRVTWIPQAMIDALDAGACIPNINAEYDPLFEGRAFTGEADDFEGEDGGVRWVDDAPGGFNAIRLGAFGIVTNNLLAQVAVTNYSSGILSWIWTTHSESSYDHLEFLLNGNRTNWISGKLGTSWYLAHRVLPNDEDKTRDENRATRHIFGFRYKKDRDVSVFEDCGWLRQAVWMPTFLLQLESATNTAFSLPPPYDTFGDALAEAGKGVFPIGSSVTVAAEPPADGWYFDSWEGTVAALAPGDVTSPTCSFGMPAYDVLLRATYTTNAPPASPAPPASLAPSRITRFALEPQPPAAAGGLAPLAAGSLRASVSVTFEAAPYTDYDLLFSPALAGPACDWQPLPPTFREVLGDTADGKRLVRLYAEAPPSAPQGFFRITPR